MKKYLYIGQENGKEVVIETSMDKPEIKFTHEQCDCIECDKMAQLRDGYAVHLLVMPRIEVISPIPAYWKKGEEVQVTKRHQLKTMETDWINCSEEGYFKSNRHFGLKRIVAIPIDKAVEPEHIADTGKMIEEDGTIIQFLMGTHSFNGIWYGQKVSGPSFWWRAELRKYLEEPTPHPTDNSFEEEAEQYADSIINKEASNYPAWTTVDIWEEIKQAFLTARQKTTSLQTDNSFEEEATYEFPVKIINCSPSESNHQMGGMCDVNYYERQAYIKGRQKTTSLERDRLAGEADFLKFISNERESFVTFFNSLEWRIDLRTHVESLLIAYDQMRENLK